MKIQELLEKYTTWIWTSDDYSEMVISTEDAVLFAQEYARLKCLETAKNVRYEAIEIILNNRKEISVPGQDNLYTFSISDCERDIQNIDNNNVLPLLD